MQDQYLQDDLFTVKGKLKNEIKYTGEEPVKLKSSTRKLVQKVWNEDEKLD